MDDWSLSSRVSPFRYLRIVGYLLLPEAFRSLSRLSSALSAKASTLRSFLLDLVTQIYSVISEGLSSLDDCFVYALSNVSRCFTFFSV